MQFVTAGEEEPDQDIPLSPLPAIVQFATSSQGSARPAPKSSVSAIVPSVTAG